MNSLVKSLIIITVCILISSCTLGYEYTPWSSNLPVYNYTQTSLDELAPTSNCCFTPFRIAVLADSHLGIGGLRNIIDILNTHDDIAFPS